MHTINLVSWTLFHMSPFTYLLPSLFFFYAGEKVGNGGPVKKGLAR